MIRLCLELLRTASKRVLRGSDLVRTEIARNLGVVQRDTLVGREGPAILAQLVVPVVAAGDVPLLPAVDLDHCSRDAAMERSRVLDVEALGFIGVQLPPAAHRQQLPAEPPSAAVPTTGW